MDIRIKEINRKSPFINYVALQQATENFLGPNCKEATLYVYNNFPAPVSVEGDVDLLILLNVNKGVGGYGKFGQMYVQNAIISIQVNNHYKDSTISQQAGEIILNNNIYRNDAAHKNIVFGLHKFLEVRCELEYLKTASINHFEFIVNASFPLKLPYYQVGKEIDFNDLFSALKPHKDDKNLCTYGKWKDNDAVFHEDVKFIFSQAEKFRQTGKLSRKKISQLKQVSQRVYNISPHIGKRLVSIEGKAGSGKTTLLMGLLVNQVLNNERIIYLTYNHLLKMETAALLHTIRSENNNSETVERQENEVQVKTLMSFFHDVAVETRVVDLVTQERIKILVEKLKSSLRRIVPELHDIYNETPAYFPGGPYEYTLKLIQENRLQAIEDKFNAINFIKFLKRKNLSFSRDFKETANPYFIYAKDLLKRNIRNNYFLTDYPGCLDNIYLLLSDPEMFFNYKKIDSDDELAKIIDEIILEDDDDKDLNMQLSLFKSFIKEKETQISNRHSLVFVDESHDCLTKERDILYHLFGSKVHVITDGGKEQLIRFHQTCNWKVFKGVKVSHHPEKLPQKTFRYGKAVGTFATYLMAAHNLEYKQKLSTKKNGKVIIDFNTYNDEAFKRQAEFYLKRGESVGYNAMESLLVFDGGFYGSCDLVTDEDGIVIDDFDVINPVNQRKTKTPPYFEALSGKLKHWNGYISEKRDLLFPMPDEFRIIHYASCRGLEAHSVMCMNLDKYYETKMRADDADKYMLGEKGLELYASDRRKLYAATAVLMAVTRAEEGLYIHISNSDSEMGRLCRSFGIKHPDLCEIR